MNTEEDFGSLVDFIENKIDWKFIFHEEYAELQGDFRYRVSKMLKKQLIHQSLVVDSLKKEMCYKFIDFLYKDNRKKIYSLLSELRKYYSIESDYKKIVEIEKEILELSQHSARK